jgi:hypothetical protein
MNIRARSGATEVATQARRCANPEKSNRAISADTGLSEATVRNARQELVNNDQLEDGPRTGLDGKTRSIGASSFQDRR